MGVLIVAEHASLKFGGEAALPLHYYRILRRRQIPVWLVVHERTRGELQSLFPLDRDRIVFVPDTKAHLIIWRLSRLLPDRISNFTAGFLLRYLTQVAQRRAIRRLLREQAISVIHQPIPVSPKEPSLIFGMNVPVIMGPMNGGMHYPPGFLNLQTRTERLALAAGRGLADFMNYLMPGKRRASTLLVANERIPAALPRRVCSNVVMPWFCRAWQSVVAPSCSMAMEVPVIATAWVDRSTISILRVDSVKPSSKEAFIDDLALALIRLATHPQDRRAWERLESLRSSETGKRMWNEW